jgi:hypothetical protein
MLGALPPEPGKQTEQLSPSLKVTTLENERLRDEENYLREYEAVFTDSVSSWINPEILDPCVVRGRIELPPRRGARYVAAIDRATRHNDFALVIAELSPEQKVIQALVRRWRGTKKAPIPYELVLGEIKSAFEADEINAVIGDQYYCDSIGQHLLKLGIIHKVSVIGPQTRSKRFANLKHLLVQMNIELLDDPDLLRELRNLQELKTERGQIDVRPSPGTRDDSAVALAVAGNHLTKLDEVRVPFLIGNIPTSDRFSTIIRRTVRTQPSVQTVDATLVCSLPAGVSKPSVFLGR